MTSCPCSSGKAFSHCCEPHILNQSAPTAQALMRSRYTAYTLVNAEYLHDTTHPKTRRDHKIIEIKTWAEANTWNRLEIISTEHGNRNDSRGIVEFKAYFTDAKGKAQAHHERSTFLKEGEQWFYVDGKFDPRPLDLTKKPPETPPALAVVARSISDVVAKLIDWLNSDYLTAKDAEERKFGLLQILVRPCFSINTGTHLCSLIFDTI